MYGNGLLGGVAGVTSGLAGTSATLGALPFTGLNVIWLAIGSFALVMAAGALWRIVPRRQA